MYIVRFKVMHFSAFTRTSHIQKFSASSYQTVLSRVVLQSSPDSSVDIATLLRAERPGIRFPVKARDFYLSQNRPDRLRGQPMLVKWAPGISPPRVKGPGSVVVRWTSVLMSAAVPQLSYDFITAQGLGHLNFHMHRDLVYMFYVCGRFDAYVYQHM
jgi:hypothetical protein